MKRSIGLGLVVALMLFAAGCLNLTSPQVPPPPGGIDPNLPDIVLYATHYPSPASTGTPVEFCVGWANRSADGYLQIDYKLTVDGVVTETKTIPAFAVPQDQNGGACTPFVTVDTTRAYLWSVEAKWGPTPSKLENEWKQETDLCVVGQCIRTQPVKNF